MPFIRSKRFIGTSSMEPRLIADALLTQMSMPPNCSTALATADSTDSGSRTSPTMGSAWPPASFQLLGRRIYGARQLRVRLGGLGDEGDVGTVLGGPLGDREADPAAGAGDEH